VEHIKYTKDQQAKVRGLAGPVNSITSFYTNHQQAKVPPYASICSLSVCSYCDSKLLLQLVLVAGHPVAGHISVVDHILCWYLVLVPGVGTCRRKTP
jgi:hypothetical protein